MAEYFLDTEFIENGGGEPLHLLSIALVREDGTSYYAEDAETDQALANDWVRENVIPHLQGGAARKSRVEIRADLIAFVGNWRASLAPTKPRFWGYFADYDWVLLCGLMGRMVDLPEGFPFYCWDLKQYAEERGISKAQFPEQAAGSEHHALADARWNLALWRFLRTQTLK